MSKTKFVIEINDNVLYGITQARTDYNAALQPVGGPPDPVTGLATQLPNPDSIATDAEFFRKKIVAVVEGWALLYAPAAPPPPPPPPVVLTLVPQAVDMVKAQVYFERIGKLAQIEAAVAAAGNEAKIIWSKSKTVQRENTLMLQIAYGVLGWTDSEIDFHFTEADKVAI